MFHPGRPETECAGGQLAARGLIKFFAHAKVEGSGDDSDVLDFWMRMRGDYVAIGHHQTHGEGPIFGWVALQNGQFRSGRKRGRAWLPLDLWRLVNRRLILRANLG